MHLKHYLVGGTLAGLLLSGCGPETTEDLPAHLNRSIKVEFNDGNHGKVTENTEVSVQCADNLGVRTLILNGQYAGETTQSIPQNALAVASGPDYAERQTQLLNEIGPVGDLVPCSDDSSYRASR